MTGKDIETAPSSAALRERLAIVLLHPQTPENVGSIARAMANLGLARLLIAGSPGIARDPAARRLAVHCEDILESAGEAPDLESALSGFQLVIGTTAHRSYETWDLLEPRSVVALARAVPGPVALVFGSERYGMSRADLRRCDQVLHLPTARPGESLNLAQARLVVAWECWREPDPVGGLDAAADQLALEPPGPDVLGDLGQDWIGILEASGFLKPHNREKKLATLRRVLSRVGLTPSEAASLQGLGSKLALLCGQRLGRTATGGALDSGWPLTPPEC